MLSISQNDLAESGGILRAIVYKGAAYLESIIGRPNIKSLGSKERELRRIIVHVNPHLDEYVADLLFVAALPPDLRSVPFEEQTLYSLDNDSYSQLTWPTSAVFGFGGAVSGGAKPLVLFDEHTPNQARSDVSCCQMVADALFEKLPDSVRFLLREANAIDANAGAHDQNLSTLIKDMPLVRFQLGTDPTTGEEVTDFLSHEYKRAIVHACLVAVVYCLENGIDLENNVNEKVDALRPALERYTAKTQLRHDPAFQQVNSRQKSLALGQSVVFRDAFLRNDRGALTDDRGQRVPQLLLFSRIIFACHKCWGPGIADLIATHIFEVFYRAQFGFEKVEAEIAALFAGRAGCRHSSIGTVERVSLPDIHVRADRRRLGKTEQFEGNLPLIVLGVVPAPGVIKANKAAMNYINEKNWGVGIVFMNDSAQGTKSIFKAQNLPNDKWDRFCRVLQDREPKIWHRPIFDRGPAPYMLNGTASHKELDRSGLGFGDVLRILRSTCYK
jgi:hypothetical protein